MREKKTYMILNNESAMKDVLSKMDFNSYYYDSVDLIIYTDTDDFQIFLKESKRLGVSTLMRSFEMEYSDYELENANYLLLNITTYCCNGFSKDYGTVFSNEKKCSCCGSGASQVSELYIDKTKMGKKNIGCTYSNEVVISEWLYHIFIDNNCLGVEFGKVKHKNDKMKNEPTLYQLIPTNTLPALDRLTLFEKEKYCDCCHKTGLFPRSIPHYDANSLVNAKDFNYTFEYFGGGRGGHPFIIVSQKVYKLLRDNKVKGVSFDVVKIV